MSHMTFTFKGVTQPNDFLSEIKSTGNKTNINKQYYIKLKSLHSKGNYQKNKKTTMKWNKVHKTDHGYEIGEKKKTKKKPQKLIMD